MLKKIDRLKVIREVKFSDIDVFKRNERVAAEEIISCDKNIEMLLFKIKQIDEQNNNLKLGSDLQNAFQLRMKLDMTLRAEQERRYVLIENHKNEKNKLNKKLAEDNAFGKLIDKKNRVYRDMVINRLRE
ncbi:hypothetical protein [Photobacterium damselae]|uniref:hypothetical protein n=1 Tax=Photobacterium damselae TaxID=38293 RepID=UPI001F3FA3F1|nr:hypothetical protein [Photobacterium damselae]UKA04600.1 hypothetical protein IHC89_23565 [Photobacterium damselae subsp. damselae]